MGADHSLFRLKGDNFIRPDTFHPHGIKEGKGSSLKKSETEGPNVSTAKNQKRGFNVDARYEPAQPLGREIVWNHS
jgi:hypothetical protein